MVILRALWANRQGASAAEFALVLPLLLLLMFGIIDAGRYMYAVNMAEKATQAGARVAIVTTPLVSEIVTTNYVGKNVGGTILTQGDRVPAGALGLITCTNAGCTCVTQPCPSDTLTHNPSAFTAILLPRMQALMPDIAASNVLVEYRGSGLGFAGDPNGADIAPLVTVRLTQVQLPLLSTLMFASLGLPSVSTTLPAEDLSGTASF
jgi:hypothetical protein